MKKVLLSAALFFLFSALINSVSPELEFSVGFADRFRSGTISPAAVFIRSPDADIEADLVLEFTAGTALKEGARYSFRRHLRVPAGTPGVFRFSLPLEVSSYPLVARLEYRGLVLAGIEKELRPLNVDRPLIVGLSRRPSLDSLIPVLSSRFQRQIELVYPRAEFLPISPEAWEGVSLVIWHDLLPDVPDPESLEALSLWIEGGGEMIVIGGPWLAGRTFTGTLLPAGIQAPRIINGIASYLPETGLSDSEIIVFPRGRGRILYIPRDMVSTALPEDERQSFWKGLTGTLIIQEGWNTRENNRVKRIEDTIEAAWFHDEESLLMPLRGPLILLGIFTLAAGGLLLAGRRIERQRLRILQLGMILFLSASVSSVAVLKYLPPGNGQSLTPGILRMLVTANYGSSRLSNRVRFAGSGAVSIDWPLPEGGVSTLPGGGNLNIVYEPAGPALYNLKLEPWTPVVLVHEAIRPGYRSGRGAEQRNPDGFRHNGYTNWFDVVLIDGGSAWQLAPDWSPGEILRLPERSSPADLPVLPPGGYSRVIQALIPVSLATGPMVLARDGEDTIILHLGDGL